jgi:hypothetical protein
MLLGESPPGLEEDSNARYWSNLEIYRAGRDEDEEDIEITESRKTLGL